jgi:hypothetical protein
MTSLQTITILMMDLNVCINDEIQNLSLLFNMSINLELLINKYLFIMQNMKKTINK